MPGDPTFEVFKFRIERTHRFGVPVSEFLNACNEYECQRVDFLRNAAGDGSVPLVVEHQLLDLR